MNDLCLRNLNDLRGGFDKHWPLSSKKEYSRIHNFLQKVNYSIQDLNKTVSEMNSVCMKDVVFLIILTTWIQEAVQQVFSCYKKEIIEKFCFDKEVELEQSKKYIQAIRSLVVAHPLTTNRHKTYGFDGDVICVDVRSELPTYPFVPEDRFQYLNVDGCLVNCKKAADYFLFTYSNKKDAMKYFCFIGCSLKDLSMCASVFVEKLYAFDKYLSKIKQKDLIEV